MKIGYFKELVDECFREAKVNAPWTIIDVAADNPHLVAAARGKWITKDDDLWYVRHTHIEFAAIWIEHFHNDDVARETILHEGAHWLRGDLVQSVFQYTGGHDHVWEDICVRLGIPAHLKMPKNYLPTEPDVTKYYV